MITSLVLFLSLASSALCDGPHSNESSYELVPRLSTHPTSYRILSGGNYYHYGDLDSTGHASQVSIEPMILGSDQPRYFTYLLRGQDGREIYKWEKFNGLALEVEDLVESGLGFFLWGPTGELYTIEVSAPGYSSMTVSFICDGTCAHDLGTVYLSKAPVTS